MDATIREGITQGRRHHHAAKIGGTFSQILDRAKRWMGGLIHQNAPLDGAVQNGP